MTTKVSEVELDNIKQLRDAFSNTYVNIGITESKIKDLEEENERNYQILKQLRINEEELYLKLKETYGDGTLDLVTGEFNSENK